MSKESPPPSPSKVAAAAAASAAVEPDFDIVVPSLGPDATLEQRQLAEFNQWVHRYNIYQHQLEAYWRGRLQAEADDGNNNAADTFQSKKGSINTDKWMRRYEELIEFKEEHGHANVPSQFTYKLSPPLGDWVKRMRRTKRDGKLTDARQKLLLDIGFEFDKPKGGGKKVVFSGVWNKAYLELCDYQDEHGNIEVPDNYKHTPESSCLLDMWIKRQRTAFKAGKLDNDLIQKLEEVGVDLSGRARPFGYELDADWTSTYKELKKYSDSNGNCNVPEGDGNLGAWAKAQREAYGEGQLNEHKAGMLQNLGFNFFSKGPTVSKDPWDSRFSELQAYHKVHGDTNVPRYFPLNLALGEFVHDLRTGYQHGALTEGRKKLLKDIGFTFVTSKGRKNTNKWDATFEELKRYKAKHGTIDIPDSDKSNVVLAGWVSRQRRYQRDQTLKKDRYEKLKAFGFDFGGPAQVRSSWETQYQAIVEFKEEHGHLKIPTNYEPNPSLYFWIGTQRQSYKHGKLSEERIEKLTELGIDLEIQQSRERPKGKSGPAFLNPKEWDRCFDSTKVGEVFVDPFVSSLYMLAEKGVKKHMKEMEESTDTASLTKQGKFHQLSSTPTSGILGTAFGSHFKEIGSSKDMQMNDGDPRNQITIDADSLSTEMKALATCIMLIGSSERAFQNNFGKGFVDILLALLNSSNSLPVLVTVVSIMGKWLLAEGQAPITKSERRAMLLGLARFDFERLSEVEARCLSDQICCFVLMAYGYDRSVIENYPFGVDRNQSMSIIRVSSPNGGLIGQEAFQKLFIACLLSANQYIRTLCTAIFGMRSSDCILVHGELSKLAIERGCRANDSIDIAGIPYREPKDILRQLLGSDFECIGGRLWTTVVLDVLLATSNHQGGVRARALGSVEADEEGAFASFMPLKSYGDDCAQDNKIELRYVDFDDGVYSSFVEVISAERSEQFCGKGRCIAAVRQIIHGDSRTFQSLFEHCIQAAWQSLPSNTARISLVQPLEALLAKPYHSQFTNAYNSPKVNAIQSMLRLLVKLRPIPVLDTFLLQSLSSDYNAIHEVLTYFECEYDALRKNQVDVDSSPHHLVKAIQRCYDALGERDVCTSISSAISSAQTKFALSLDMYGFVNESVDAYGALIDRAGDDTSLLPSEDELQIWEQRWVGSHKDMSQWSLIDEFATSHGEARLSLEAAWKTKNWEKVKSLFATPSVVALLEEGDQCAKMTEMYLAIQEGNLDEVDSIHAQIAQLCLYRWQLLPSISSGSQAHQSLLQQCTRLVELRESSQLLVETNAHVSRQTVPDLKTLLTAWKHRSPNLFEPISEWEDLFLWRSNIFDAITSNFGWVEPGTLATLHDRPHCCITLSRAARKQDLKEVSTFTMSSLGDSIMDVDTAFLKWREEVTTYQHSSENMLKGGLNLVNSANVSYFSDRQKAEVFRLKAYFLNELRDKPKANQAYCQAVQICPNHARSWQDWGDLCVSLSDATRKKLADDKADKKDLAKKASQYLSQAAGCYLEALRVDTSEQSRDRIPHCLSMLAADGRQYGSVCRTLQARGASTPAWCWLPWIPQLLSSLCRVEARAVKPILIGILKDHPQALYYSLRSFFLERRDVEKSMPDQKSDCASKEESDYQSSLKLAEIIMSSLRKTHPVLWNRLEVILDNLIVRFRPSYEAELLQTIIALINRTIKAEEKIHDNADGDNNEEKRMEYYEKTLSRIGDKFFSKSSSLSKKALHFQSRYGSLFDSDFGQSNLGSFEELIEKLQKWKALLERQVSRVPTKCKLSESSPALSWFSSQAPDMWAGACSSKSFSASNSRQDSLSSPQFYDSTRSSALKAARASSYSVLLAAQSEGIDGYAGGGAAAVEIPGQYSPTSAGVFDSRPIPEMHAKLVRFKQILEVTSTGSTKQHVHRITMIGSDGKEYKFLLQLAAPYSTRTDERSAQMQFIMGKTLRGDIRACRRGLIVRPNVVIPLAQRMRMSATQDSHQSLESILHCVQRSAIDLPTHFQEMVDERVSKIGDIDNDARLTAEKNAKLEVYTEICQHHMSSDNLTKYMMQILPSTESLCQFRKEFASHLAANSVLQYALAAVERTPTRFVLCNKTGQVLAHDLRSSYNHGLLENQAVPFRLTRNITEFIGPFLLDGVFVPSFVSISGAMSSRRNVLEPMLHLLLRDDVISWYTSKTSAANDKKIQDIELQLSDRVWKNVRFVQQRLDSCAPERVENAAEAIKGTVAPIDMKVRTLVDAACSVDRLSSMAPSYQAWL